MGHWLKSKYLTVCPVSYLHLHIIHNNNGLTYKEVHARGFDAQWIFLGMYLDIENIMLML